MTEDIQSMYDRTKQRNQKIGCVVVVILLLLMAWSAFVLGANQAGWNTPPTNIFTVSVQGRDLLCIANAHSLSCNWQAWNEE